MGNNMEQTKKKLQICFWTGISSALLLLLFFELLDDLWGLGAKGVLATCGQVEFWLLTLMEIVTPASIVLALRLFKFKHVSNALREQKYSALLQWGLLRLLLLELPLLLNVLLYYLMMTASFGYLAIIVIICLPFVFPSSDRCLTEIEA